MAAHGVGGVGWSLIGCLSLASDISCGEGFGSIQNRYSVASGKRIWGICVAYGVINSIGKFCSKVFPRLIKRTPRTKTDCNVPRIGTEMSAREPIMLPAADGIACQR